MGALHQGHLRLLSEANQHTDISICSIFVNPTQFNNTTDLAKYPRTVPQDIRLLEENGCDVLFLPSAEEVYREEKQENFSFGGLDILLEGDFRPGHFEGVARVVKLLFGLVQPHQAFFGLKDFQQCLVIKNLVKQFEIPVELVFVPTEREPDGLAMSSRNMRLTPAERKNAASISLALQHAAANAGKIPVATTIRESKAIIEAVEGLRVEYFTIADARTLLPVEDWDAATEIVALTAVFAGEVRLIDNLYLKK